MRRFLLGAILILGVLTGGGQAQEPAPKAVVERVTRALTDADPLAEGSTSDLLAPDDTTWQALMEVARSEAETDVARDRALRIRIALNRVARVTEGFATDDHWHVWWMALDELDREYPRGPRETLLALALPDEAKRAAALKELAAGRDVAARFCSEWNELERNAQESKKYAALRAELEKAGNAAIPYLATLLAVPPQAVFTVMDEKRGITARQQVRALWALDFLKADGCWVYALFHVRGPSFTQCAAARTVLEHFTDIEYPPGGDEAAQLAVIDARWTKRWSISWERDHLIRHTLKWARAALASDDPTQQHWASSGPRQLATLLGPLDYDADAPIATRRAQLAQLERDAMRNCPVCIR